MATYFKMKTKFLAVKWTGSNEAEVDAFLATLPKVDSFYAFFENVDTTVSGTTLTISCDSNSPNYPDDASLQFTQNSWIVEGLAPGLSSGIGLVKSANEPLVGYDPSYSVVEQ